MNTGTKAALVVLVLADNAALDVAHGLGLGFLTTYFVGFAGACAVAFPFAYWMDRYEDRVRRETCDAIRRDVNDAFSRRPSERGYL